MAILNFINPEADRVAASVGAEASALSHGSGSDSVQRGNNSFEAAECLPLDWGF